MESQERNSFVFYKSFYNAISTADEHTQNVLYKAICEYALFGKAPELEGIAYGFWLLIEPVLNTNWEKYTKGLKGKDYGKLGGNPVLKKRVANPYYNHGTNTPATDIKHTTNNSNDVGNDIKDNNNDSNTPKKRTIFKKPTIDEVKAYCSERNNNVDVDLWYSHYESNGWKVGKNAMKDWKAAIRTWERNYKDATYSTRQQSMILNNNSEDKYNKDVAWK